MRYLGLILTLGCYVTCFMYMDWKGLDFLVPFTNWTLMLTTASLYSSIQAAQDSTNFGKDALSRGEAAVWL